MLWLALVLPALPLQLAERAFDCTHLMSPPGRPKGEFPPGGTARSAKGAPIIPIVIVDGPPQRLQVIHGNSAARAAGIAPGMKLAAAQALARDLVALERNAEREHEALAELAAWAYQFSAQVVVQRDGVLLETGASERLFGGRARLNELITAGLAELGYRGVSAQAATPRGARLLALARARGSDTPTAASRLEQVLALLPFTLLEWDAPTNETLRALGLATIGDLLRLPRDSFAKRFGAARLADLDRTLGARADPQPLYEPPARFAASIELPADMSAAAQLMFPAQRLLASLEGFLRGRNAGATELMFSATHSARRGAVKSLSMPPTAIALTLAAPERDAKRLAALLAERLARVTLPAPAIMLALAVERLHPFAMVNASLLPPSGAQGGEFGVDWLRLAETLHARLGSGRVFQLQAVDDHRPEHAWRAVPLTIDGDLGSAPLPLAPRPLLLLPAPQPLPVRDEQPCSSQPCSSQRDPLTLVTGPERIECGWWDLGGPAAGAPHRAVHRDYFVARNASGQWLWIFRELAAPRGWFLHGMFA